MTHPPKHGLIKKLAIVVTSLALVAGVAWGTTRLLSYVINKDSPATELTPEQKAADAAKQNMSGGLKSESTGKTAEAIAAYKEALKNYQEAGDKSGEEAVKLKIQYLESIP